MSSSNLPLHDFPSHQPLTGAARPSSQFVTASKEIGYVKGSLYGPPGTGKTTVMAMLLIYLSKTYHSSAPVAWLASEKGVDFVLDFFKAEMFRCWFRGRVRSWTFVRRLVTQGKPDAARSASIPSRTSGRSYFRKA